MLVAALIGAVVGLAWPKPVTHSRPPAIPSAPTLAGSEAASMFSGEAVDLHLTPKPRPHHHRVLPAVADTPAVVSSPPTYTPPPETTVAPARPAVSSHPKPQPTYSGTTTIGG